MKKNLHRFLFLLAAILLFTGCAETMEWQGIQSSRVALQNSIKAEEQGEYWIGRRYYKQDYKFWGYIRRPGEAWSTARLVMLNEQTKLAPDREGGTIGSDNGYEYKLTGDFSGQTVYEPASNGKYPEFVLRGYELRSASPPNIFSTPGALDPARRVIARPN